MRSPPAEEGTVLFHSSSCFCSSSSSSSSSLSYPSSPLSTPRPCTTCSSRPRPELLVVVEEVRCEREAAVATEERRLEDVAAAAVENHTHSPNQKVGPAV